MAIQTKDTSSFVKGVIRAVKTEGMDSVLLPKTEKILRRMSIVDRASHAATVRSALELNPGQKDSVKSALESLVSHELTVEYIHDPSLIAGLKVQIGDFVVDTSFSNQIDRLGNSLLK